MPIIKCFWWEFDPYDNMNKLLNPFQKPLLNTNEGMVGCVWAQQQLVIPFNRTYWVRLSCGP